MTACITITYRYCVAIYEFTNGKLLQLFSLYDLWASRHTRASFDGVSFDYYYHNFFYCTGSPVAMRVSSLGVVCVYVGNLV